MLTLNTADIMGSPKQFPEYHEPEVFVSPTQFPEYFEPPEFVGSPFQFPEYCKPEPEPIDIMSNLEDSPTTPTSPANKLLEQVVRTPGRQPSPQPTHFSVPSKNGNSNGNGHRILRSATVGYIAPEFKGKKDQMLQGSSLLCY
jgi:hypothetical protein